MDQGRWRALSGQGGRGAERQRLWDLATEFYPGFARYQERAGDRRIPVVVCTPAGRLIRAPACLVRTRRGGRVWLIAAALKAVDRVLPVRGFESLPLR